MKKNINLTLHTRCNTRTRYSAWLAGLFFVALPAFAQPSDMELADPSPAPAECWSQTTHTHLGWGSTDMRYKRNAVPQLSSSLTLTAWKGERVSAQAVLVCPNAIDRMSFTVTDLTCGKQVIPASQVKKYFVRYVLCDSLPDRSKELLLADRLQPATEMTVPASTVRPLWLDIKVPSDQAPGKYKGMVKVKCDNEELELPLTVQVSARVLPPPSQWAFHLDLWQNPYSVARFFGVPLWSKEHFDLMRPTMELLANAGEKVITASIIQHPWNSQTEDPFESMIGKFKRIDGTWHYDYTVFDRWVEFMMDCGIKEQIDCYTLLPWHLTFEYFSEAENCTHQVKLEPGTAAYEGYLLPFLKDFAAHLKQKGWFEKTCIAMDERPKELLEPAYAVLAKSGTGFKVEGAINYFGPEVAERMYDVSFAYEQPLLEPQQLADHLAQDKRVTFYTCCGPDRPNTFVCSPPAESTFLGWHAAAAGYSGYLRWAYNSWVKNPWQDARFRSWLAGDCFLVYPDGSSIRMERLVEGIQDYEKIRILRSELKGKKLERLNSMLEPFATCQVDASANVEEMVRQAKATLRSLE